MTSASRPRRRISRALLLALIPLACGASLREAPIGPHPTGATPIVIAAPPPPAKIEVPGADPGPPCVWLDGQWDWVDQTWRWKPGAWVVPPPGCHHADPEAVWVPAADKGVLFYLPGRWYRDSGTATCAEPGPCGPAGSGQR